MNVQVVCVQLSKFRKNIIYDYYMYKITEYSFKKADSLGVTIKASTRKNKKIDVYDKQGKYITSIGDSRYKDYPTYMKENGTEYANERRRLYRIRHKNDLETKGAGYYAWYILW